MNLGFVLFPRLTQLDLTGPFEVLARVPGATCHLIAATLDPVTSDTGLTILPTMTFADCPQLDVLCVPGGSAGVSLAIQDRELLDFLRRQAPGCDYVTSVCTGSLLLGAAGLLHGKRATTHWASLDKLREYGALVTPGRVVRDGSLLTGGGVTAGLDFGLTLAAELAGPQVAQALQLGLEYDPHPPFDAGTPHTAPEAIVTIVRAQLSSDERP